MVCICCRYSTIILMILFQDRFGFILTILEIKNIINEIKPLQKRTLIHYLSPMMPKVFITFLLYFSLFLYLCTTAPCHKRLCFHDSVYRALIYGTYELHDLFSIHLTVFLFIMWFLYREVSPVYKHCFEREL